MAWYDQYLDYADTPQPRSAVPVDDQQDDDAEFEQWRQERFGAPAQEDRGSFIGDIGRNIATGFTSGIEGDVAVADYAIGGSETTGAALDKLVEWRESLQAGLTDEAKAGAAKTFLSEEEGEWFGEAWSDPDSYLNIVAQGLGSLGAMLATGGPLKGLAVKGATKAFGKEVAGKAGKQISDKAKNRIGMGAYGAAEGAMVSGMTGRGIEEELMQMPDDLWNQAPPYQHEFWRLKDESPDMPDTDIAQQAKENVSRGLAVAGAKDIALPAVLLGSVAGKYVDDMLSGVRKGMGRGKAAGLGATSEGLTEAPQGAMEQLIQNVRAAEIDPSIAASRGVGEAAIQEGIGGAGAGAILGGVTGGDPAERMPAESAAARAALPGGQMDLGLEETEVTGPVAPEETAPGAYPAAPPVDPNQMDMFGRNAQQAEIDAAEMTPGYEPSARQPELTEEEFLASQGDVIAQTEAGARRRQLDEDLRASLQADERRRTALGPLATDEEAYSARVNEFAPQGIAERGPTPAPVYTTEQGMAGGAVPAPEVRAPTSRTPEKYAAELRPGEATTPSVSRTNYEVENAPRVPGEKGKRLSKKERAKLGAQDQLEAPKKEAYPIEEKYRGAEDTKRRTDRIVALIDQKPIKPTDIESLTKEDYAKLKARVETVVDKSIANRDKATDNLRQAKQDIAELEASIAKAEKQLPKISSGRGWEVKKKHIAEYKKQLKQAQRREAIARKTATSSNETAKLAQENARKLGKKIDTLPAPREQVTPVEEGNVPAPERGQMDMFGASSSKRKPAADVVPKAVDQKESPAKQDKDKIGSERLESRVARRAGEGDTGYEGVGEAMSRRAGETREFVREATSKKDLKKSIDGILSLTRQANAAALTAQGERIQTRLSIDPTLTVEQSQKIVSDYAAKVQQVAQRSYMAVPDTDVQMDQRIELLRQRMAEQATGSSSASIIKKTPDFPSVTTFEEMGTVFAEVQTSIPDSLKSHTLRKQVDEVYEKLEFGDYNTLAEAKKDVAKTNNALMNELRQREASLSRQGDLFPAELAAVFEQQSNDPQLKKGEASSPVMREQTRSDIDRLTAQRLQALVEKKVKGGMEQDDAVSWVVKEMRKAKLPIPASFLTEDTMNGVAKAANNIRDLTGLLDEKSQAALNARKSISQMPGVASRPVTEEAGEMIAQYGTGMGRAKIKREKSNYEKTQFSDPVKRQDMAERQVTRQHQQMVADAETAHDLSIQEGKLPDRAEHKLKRDIAKADAWLADALKDTRARKGRKKGEATMPGPKSAAAKHKLNKAAEGVRKRYDDWGDSGVAVVEAVKAKTAARLLESVNAPQAIAMQVLAEDVKAKRVSVEDGKTEFGAIMDSYLEYAGTKEALAEIGGPEVYTEFAESGTSAYELLQAAGFTQTGQDIQEYMTNEISAAQREAARAGGIDPRTARGGRDGGGPRSTLRITQSERPPRERVNTRTYGGGLNDAQLEGVNLALDNVLESGEQQSAFLLGDGTGFGKTRQILATADQYVKKTGKPVLIVHTGTGKTNVGGVRQQFEADAEALGIDTSQFEFVNYASVDKNKIDKYYGLKIFDEAQNIKKPSGARFENANVEGSDAVMYVSASPADTPIGMRMLAQLEGVELDEFMSDLGMVPSEELSSLGKYEVAPHMTWGQVALRLARKFNDLGKDGKLIRREYAFQSIPERRQVKPTKEAVAMQERVLEASEGMEAKDVTNALVDIAESSKAKDMIAGIDEALAKGNKVVVVLDRQQESTTRKVGDGTIEIPGLSRQIEDHLNKKDVEFVSYYGDKGKPDNFQNGTARVIIMTPEKGGVGLNLDDTVGDTPRTMIVSHVPYSAVEWTQLLGRIDRHSTKSIPEFIFLDSGLEGDNRARNILRHKMRIQNSATMGVPIAPEYLGAGDTQYSVRDMEDGKVGVTLNTDQDVTTRLSAYISRLGGGKPRFDKGRNEWVMTPAQWKRIQPDLDMAIEVAQNATKVTLKRANMNENVPPQDVPAGEAATKALETAGEAGVTVTDLLDTVIDRLPDGHRFKPLATLLRSLGLQVPVKLNSDPTAPSTYSVQGTNREIYVEPNSLSALLHEMVHAATDLVLDDMNDPKVRRLNALFEQSKQVIEQKYGTDAVGMENYGVTNLKEFVAEGMSNPVFQEQLRAIEVGGQSLWNRFLNALKSLLGMQRVRQSVLDEVLRITPTIMQNEGEVQLGYMLGGPSNAVATRELQRPILNRLGPQVAAGTEQVSQAMDSLRPRGLGVLRRLREMVKLPLMSMRQIGESYGRLFTENGVDLIGEYLGLLSKKERVAREHQRKADFQLRKWTEYKNKNGVEEQALSALMGDATLADAHPDQSFNSDANRHLRDNAAGESLPAKVVAANKAAHAKVQAAYGNLSAEGKALYKDIREFYTDDWNTTVNHILTNILDNAETPYGSYTPQKILAMSTAKMARQTLLEDMNAYLEKNSNLSDREVKDLKRAAESFREDIGEVMTKAKRKGPYFPLRRFGDYVVEATGNWTSEKFGSRTEAVARKAELEAENPTIDTEIEGEGDSVTLKHRDRAVEFYETWQDAEQGRQRLSQDYSNVTTVTAKEQYNESKGMSGALIERVTSRLDDPRLSSAVRSAFTQMMPETSIHKANLRRGSVQGFSHDMRRAFAAHAKSSSHYLSQLEFGKKLAGSMESIANKVKTSKFASEGEQVKMQNVLAELKKRDAFDVTEMSTNKVLDGASNVGFVWYLLSPSYWMVNATQPHMIATPWLAAQFKGGGAMSAMSHAYKAIMPEILNRTGKVLKAGLKGDTEGLGEIADFLTEDGTVGQGFIDRIKKSGKYTPQMQTEIIGMLNDLGETGIIDMTFAADLRTTAEGGEKSLLSKTTEWARIMPHLVEVMNRTVTATAAYDLARKNGQDVEAARRFAEKAVASTQFDYGAVNKPRYFSERQFQLARPVFMFMQHSQHMYYMMLRSITRAFPAIGKKLRGQELTEQDREELRIGGRVFAGVTASHALVAGAVGATFEPVKWAIGLGAMAFGEGDEPWDYEQAVREFMVEMFGRDVGMALTKGLPYAAGVDLSTRIAMDNLLFFDSGNSGEGRDWLESKFFGLAGPLGGIAANAAEATKNFAEGDYYRGTEQLLPKMFRDMVRAAKLNNEGMLDSRGKTMRAEADISPLELFIQAAGFSPAAMSTTYARQRAVQGAKQHYKVQRQRLLERYARARTPADKRKVWEDAKEFNRKVPAASMKISYSTLAKSMKAKGQAEQQMRKFGGVNLSDKERAFAKYGDF